MSDVCKGQATVQTVQTERRPYRSYEALWLREFTADFDSGFNAARRCIRNQDFSNLGESLQEMQDAHCDLEGEVDGLKQELQRLGAYQCGDVWYIAEPGREEWNEDPQKLYCPGCGGVREPAVIPQQEGDSEQNPTPH
jgi:hypothetical protein